MTERKRQILRCIVDSFILTAEPVGSKVISEELGVSSATIRNEMAELEAMGFLEKPHTSAGRVPAPKGYRFYVDELMRDYRLSIEETERMNSALSEKMTELDKVIDQAGRLVSKMTQLPTYSMSTVKVPRLAVKRFELIYVDPNSFILVVMTTADLVKNKLIKLPFPISDEQLPRLSDVLNTHFVGLTMKEITAELVSAAVAASGAGGALIALVLEFVSEVLQSQFSGEFHVAGVSNILSHPEYQDAMKAKELLEYLNEDGMDALAMPEGAQGKVKILIGPENIAQELKDTSVVMASYNIGDGMQGVIGVVGPTRMDYAKVTARLSYFAEGLNRMFGGPQLPPAKEEETDV